MWCPTELNTRSNPFQHWCPRHVSLDSTCDIASYTDENILYTSHVSEDLVTNNLENSCSDLFKSFKENHLKNNPDNCHLLNSNKPININLSGDYINNNNEEKLGRKIARDKIRLVTFFWKSLSLFKKVGQKLHLLSRVINNMDLDKQRCF